MEDNKAEKHQSLWRQKDPFGISSSIRECIPSCCDELYRPARRLGLSSRGIAGRLTTVSGICRASSSGYLASQNMKVKCASVSVIHDS